MFPNTIAGRVKEIAPESPVTPPEREKVVAPVKAPAGNSRVKASVLPADPAGRVKELAPDSN